MKSSKIDTSGQERAAAAAAEAQAAANNLQKNFAADLKTENLGQVIAGGGAEAATMDTTTGVRRKRQSTALSSQLGINI